MTNISRVQLAVDSSQVQRGTSALRNMQRQGRATEQGMNNMRRVVTRLGGAIAAAFSVRQIQRFTSTAISEFADLERSQLRLTRQIELMGHQSWLSADAVEAMASRIDRATLASADGVRQAASMMITNGDLTQESFERTMQVAVDMGEVFGLALPTSARYLTRAMSDAGGAMSMFRRYGVELGETVEDNIKSLADAGRESEAYALLLSELEQRFEGAAEAAGAGLAGSLDDLSRASREARENIGEQLAPAVDAVVMAMTDWIDANSEVENSGLQEFAFGVANALSYVVDAIHGVARVFAIVGRGLALGTLEWQRDFLNVADSIVNGPIRALNDMIALYNRIPMLPDLGEVAMTGIGDSIAADLRMIERAVVEAEADLNDALMTPLEGQRIRDAIADIRERMSQAGDESEDVARNFERAGRALSGGGEGGGLVDGAGFAGLTRMMERQVEMIRAQAEAFEDLQRAGQQVWEETRTPMEQFNIRMGELNEMLDAGVISWDTYARAVFHAQDRLDDMSRTAEESLDTMDEYSRQAARSMQDNLAQFLFNPWDEGLQGMLRGFGQMLQQMIAEAVAADIMGALSGSGGGNAAGLFSGIMGAFGASFAGGGYTGDGPRSGGVDGKGGFPAIMHPRETVTDHTKESRSEERPAPMNVTQNIIVPGRPDNRTANQLASESARKQQMVRSRYGA